MSRIGKRIINTEGIEVEFNKPVLRLSSGSNIKEISIPDRLTAQISNDHILIKRNNEGKEARSLHGTYRSLVNNLVNAIKEPFVKKLELHGIGYRANVEGSILNMSLGFTHPVKVNIPEGISVSVEKNILVIKGDDLQKLGQFAAEIRAIRKPEPYKGKGIRYQGEQVAIKQGKATKGSS